MGHLELEPINCLTETHRKNKERRKWCTTRNHRVLSAQFETEIRCIWSAHWIRSACMCVPGILFPIYLSLNDRCGLWPHSKKPNTNASDSNDICTKVVLCSTELISNCNERRRSISSHRRKNPGQPRKGSLSVQWKFHFSMDIFVFQNAHAESEGEKCKQFRQFTPSAQSPSIVQKLTTSKMPRRITPLPKRKINRTHLRSWQLQTTAVVTEIENILLSARQSERGTIGKLKLQTEPFIWVSCVTRLRPTTNEWRANAIERRAIINVRVRVEKKQTTASSVVPVDFRDYHIEKQKCQNAKCLSKYFVLDWFCSLLLLPFRSAMHNVWNISELLLSVWIKDFFELRFFPLALSVGLSVWKMSNSTVFAFRYLKFSSGPAIRYFVLQHISLNAIAAGPFPPYRRR